MNKDGTKINRPVRGRQSVDGFALPRQYRATAPLQRRVISTPVRPRPTFARQLTVVPVPLEPVQPEATTELFEVSNAPVQATVEAPIEYKQFPLPVYEAPERPVHPLRKRTTRTMLVLRMASAVFAIFLLTGGFLAWRGYSNLHKVFHGTETVAALTEKTVAPQLLKGEGDGRVNILLLGIGGPGHDGPDLTDTMVVMSIDPVNNTATMLSVPRDLWVKMPVNFFGAKQKINAAYESGKYHTIGKVDGTNNNTQAIDDGFAAVDTTIKSVLDININYHMLVNFQAFRQAIDTVGGVTVDVKTPLVDPTMAWENHNDPILASAGVQQMDGVKALQYARSRETTSDFARSERQRQILVALKDKVLTAGTLSNPAKIDSLLSAFGNNIYSDLTTQGAMRLGSILKNIGDSKITSMSLTDGATKLVTTDRVGTASVVRPVAGFDNYTAIQDYVHSKLLDGYLVKEHAGVAVLSATQAGATDLAATLTTYGYTVTSAAPTQQASPNPILIDLSKGKNPYTKNYLEKRLGVHAVTQLPAGMTITDTNAAFAIISNK